MELWEALFGLLDNSKVFALIAAIHSCKTALFA